VLLSRSRNGEDAALFEAVGRGGPRGPISAVLIFQPLLRKAGLFVLAAEWNAGTAH